MSGTSATGGPLAPEPALGPLADGGLDDFLQRLVVNVTGLPGNMVRPRWQETPPPRPPIGTDWCAIGVQRIVADTYASVTHSPHLEGNDVLKRHETLEVLASFYGPNAGGYAGDLRDGLLVWQNREALTAAGYGLLDTGEPLMVPELINQQWYRRCDMPLRLRRQVVRTYPVKNILSAAGTVVTEGPSTSFSVEP